MGAPAILHLEDSDLDADYIRQRMARAGLDVVVTRVRDRGDYVAALTGPQHFDLILSDYQLMTFDGIAALELLRIHRPNVPFVFVSGTLGEEVAIETLKQGATDYVLKHRLERLVPAIERALSESREREQLKRAESELREAYDRLAMAQKAGRTGMFDWHIPANRVVWTPELEELYGIPRGNFEQTFDGWVRRVVPADVAAVKALFQKSEEAKQDDIEYEFRVVRPDGTRRWLEGKAKFIRNEAGQRIRMVGINIDIHDRKQAEEQLRESEERLRLAQSAGNLGSWELDPITGVFSCTPTCKSILGLPPDVILTHELLLQRAHPDDRDRVASQIEQTLKSGKDSEVEYRIIRSDGSIHWIYLRGRVVASSGGKPLRMVGVSLDVTDRKAAEENIRRQNEHLRILAEAAEQLLACDDPERMVRDLFDSVSGRLGLAGYFHFTLSEDGLALVLTSCGGIPEEAKVLLKRLELGQAVCGTVAGTRKRCVATHIQNSSDAKVSIVKQFGFRAYACHPLMAGDRLLGTLSFATRDRDVFSDEDLEVLRTICHYVSMAKERERLAAEARAQADLLREQDRLKDEFLATLAHELRNPLAPVRTGLGVIKLADSPIERERARSMMERQISHMVRLVDDLLDVSRITRGKVELKKELVDLQSIFDAALEVSRPLIDASEHELTVTLPTGPLLLDADVTRIAQVLSNLLNNAAKYTPNKGRIELLAERQGAMVAIHVRDNGTGIPAEMLPRVFDMFTQIGRTIERAQGGLGIGLTLVKRLVDMHGGRVEADSPGPGHGSTFSVYLPLVEHSRARNEMIPSPPGDITPKQRHRRILVVDDSVDGAESLSMLLELSGHQTQVVHDGPNAIVAAREYRPEVILLDIGLPGLNGYEVAQRLRQEPSLQALVIVALTGWGSEHDRERARIAGFDYHLTKPVELTQLEEILCRVSDSIAGKR